MNCISCTSMLQVHTSLMMENPIFSVVPGFLMNLWRILRRSRPSRRSNRHASTDMHPNMPPTTAKTFHVFKTSSSDTERSSSMDTGLIFGGADEAEKSVAWLHRHCTLDERTHPHPSNVCVSLRQKHIALFRGFCAWHLSPSYLRSLTPSSLRYSTSVQLNSTESSVELSRCSNVHRNDASTEELSREMDPSSTPGSHSTLDPLGIGLGSVAQPLVDDSPAASS